MANSRDDIERDALSLPTEDRAHLVVRLLDSLEDTVETPEEMEKVWLAEANRRFQELLEGVVDGIPAAEVISELKTA